MRKKFHLSAALLVGLAVVGGKLVVEDAACQGEPVIAAGQNRVKAESTSRLRFAIVHDVPIDAQPILLQEQFVGPIVKAHRQL